MKKIYMMVLAVCSLMTACTGDLDQQPHTDSDATAEQVYSSETGYKQALGKLYASFVLQGMEQGGGNADLSSNNGQDLMRCYFNLQECATDELASTWLSGDKVEDLTYMTWDANDPWVADTYYRAYYTIALCNEFLRHATADAVQANSNLKPFRAEARFLRALAYWYVLDLFGQGPYVDETMGVGAYIPERYSNTQLFTFIESELKDITTDGLLEASATEYGRASRQAGLALLARLYLNAEVYDAGSHYTECIAACQQIIKSGFSLENTYTKLFNADNDKRTNEMIFPFVVDAVNTVTWGATTYIVCGQCGNTSSQDPAKYGLTAGWGMFRSRGELPELFSGNEQKDQRYLFYTTDQSQWLNKAIDDQSEGYFVEKYSNLTDAGETASNTGAVGCSIDYPVFRLADVYLMMAESILRGGEGSSREEALNLVNQVRQRAFGSSEGAINSGQLNLQFILDERGRELYWEGIRRTDLIRYGRFTGGDYVWQWKGGVADGKATDSKYNVYPIPTAELSANPNLSNPNY